MDENPYNSRLFEILDLLVPLGNGYRMALQSCISNNNCLVVQRKEIMKKSVLFVVTMLLLCSLVGCSSSPTVNESTSTVTSEEKTEEKQATSESSRKESSDFEGLKIVASGWYLDGKYLKYYIDLYNPSDSITVDLPKYSVTARDANGVLLGNRDHTLSIIYPGQHFIYGSQGFSVDEEPSTVEFEPLAYKDYNLKDVSITGEYEPLEVVNTAIRSDKLVGEVSNPGTKTYDKVIVVALSKDESGTLIFVDSTFVDDVKPGESVAFDISHWKKLDENSVVEYYAYEW